MGQTGVDGCGPLCCGCGGGAVGDEGVRCVYAPGGGWLGGDGNGVVVFDDRRQGRELLDGFWPAMLMLGGASDLPPIPSQIYNFHQISPPSDIELYSSAG